MKNLFTLSFFVCLTSTATLLAADLKPATPFSDHMVLQQGKPVPVWGWADPGEQISIEFGGQNKTATADANGKWTVKLDPMPSSAESRRLLIQSKTANRKAEINDVLVGEVWLGSGQSNMAMSVSRAQNFDAEKAAAKLPLIRVFQETSGVAESPQPDAKGQWLVCSPEAVETTAFSATLFFFGRELHRELQIPVGLINSSVGGTPIESWIDAGVQTRTPELKEFFSEQSKARAVVDEEKLKAGYEKSLAQWQARAAKAKAAGEPLPRRPRNPLDIKKRKGNIGGLFNGKIAPLIPYAIRGAVWYQGEANAHPGKGQFYQYQLPLLVSDWRSRWGDEFPFAWVQLPNFIRGSEGWMLVREAELKTLRLPKTGMAITVDIGEPKNIHPMNKQEVGRRLSLWALGEVYGKKIAETSGPLPAGHEVRGAEIVLAFTHAAGLQAKNGELKGFVIAGEDKQWKPAQARIEGEKVIVSSPDVKKPVAARYAWVDNPDCNLYNGAGLPASPFRTDDWPVSETAK